MTEAAAAPKPAMVPGEEAVLGKAYDLALLRKLWPFVRPHWKLLVAWALWSTAPDRATHSARRRRR